MLQVNLQEHYSLTWSVLHASIMGPSVLANLVIVNDIFPALTFTINTRNTPLYCLQASQHRLNDRIIQNVERQKAIFSQTTITLFKIWKSLTRFFSLTELVLSQTSNDHVTTESRYDAGRVQRLAQCIGLASVRPPVPTFSPTLIGRAANTQRD